MSAEIGNTVRFNFTGMLEDGTTFDSTANRDPIEAELGANALMPALEEALIGMDEGEKKTVDVAAADAFGPRRDDLVYQVERARIPAEIQLAPGVQLQATDGNNQPIQMTVVALDDETVTLDSNHPLAGRDLKFELELLEVL